MNGVSRNKETELLTTIPDLVRNELLKIDEESEVLSARKESRYELFKSGFDKTRRISI